MSDVQAVADGAARRVLVAGASGYIGRALVLELLERGFEVTALCRPPAGAEAAARRQVLAAELAPARLVELDLFDAAALAALIDGGPFDGVFSCLATRGGGVRDAWRVEHEANLALLNAVLGARPEEGDASCGSRGDGAREAEGRATHFVLLSAICVQKPRLAFQHAKLAFEAALRAAPIPWTIVRPTAYFKSLAGQVGRVRAGKPYLVFGDGRLNACKPIGERDLARFLADCLGDPDRVGRILPVGGPGPALTPRAQGELLCSILGREPSFRQVPVRLFDLVAAVLGTAARVPGPFAPGLRDKAEFARIGRYYATESMLLWDSERERYDADATPEFGAETLGDFFTRVAAEGLAGQQLGDHALFDRKAP